MSFREHENVPAGWYPDEAGDRLRWWDGSAWTDAVRPRLIDSVPDFIKNPTLNDDVVPETLAPVYDLTERLASTPERSTPAPSLAPGDPNGTTYGDFLTMPLTRA